MNQKDAYNFPSIPPEIQNLRKAIWLLVSSGAMGVRGLKALARLKELIGPPEEARPDNFCKTTPDGGCVSDDPRDMRTPTDARALVELEDTAARMLLDEVDRPSHLAPAPVGSLVRRAWNLGVELKTLRERSKRGEEGRSRDMSWKRTWERVTGMAGPETPEELEKALSAMVSDHANACRGSEASGLSECARSLLQVLYEHPQIQFKALEQLAVRWQAAARLLLKEDPSAKDA